MSTASVGIRASKPGGGGGGLWPPPIEGSPPPGVPAGVYNVTGTNYWEPGVYNTNNMGEAYYDNSLGWVFPSRAVDPCGKNSNATLCTIQSKPGWIDNVLGNWNVWIYGTLRKETCAGEFAYPITGIGFAKYTGGGPGVGTLEQALWTFTGTGAGSIYNPDDAIWPYSSLIDTDEYPGVINWGPDGDMFAFGTRNLDDGSYLTVSFIGLEAF